MDLVHANLPRSHVPALGAKVFHPAHCQLPQIAILNTRADEWHGYIPLHTVDTRPWRNERQYPGHDVDERIRRVVLVSSRAPELVQPRTANDECWVDLQAVRAKCRIFEVLVELLNVALYANVRQIGLRWLTSRLSLSTQKLAPGE